MQLLFLCIAFGFTLSVFIDVSQFRQRLRRRQMTCQVFRELYNSTPGCHVCNVTMTIEVLPICEVEHCPEGADLRTWAATSHLEWGDGG